MKSESAHLSCIRSLVRRNAWATGRVVGQRWSPRSSQEGVDRGGVEKIHPRFDHSAFVKLVVTQCRKVPDQGVPRLLSSEGPDHERFGVRGDDARGHVSLLSRLQPVPGVGERKGVFGGTLEPAVDPAVGQRGRLVDGYARVIGPVKVRLRITSRDAFHE